MPERFSDFVALFMGALALGYIAYEIERRRRSLHDLWDVLDGEDAAMTTHSWKWSRAANWSSTRERCLLDRLGTAVDPPEGWAISA
jgi:hypothetical protein